MRANAPSGVKLPVSNDLIPVYAFSVIIASLVAAASGLGLIDHARIYPTDELLRAFLANDVVNVAIGLPMLLGSMWLTWRRSLIGLLCWPGALFFILYNYIAYVFAVPLSVAFLLHLALVTLSLYALIGLFAGIDGSAVQSELSGKVPERLAGGVLAGFGALFMLRIVGVVVNALAQQAAIPETELAVHASDFLVTPSWVIVGVQLWRRKPLGYVAGLGLLFQASMLFVALIIFMLLQPVLTGAPFVLADVLVVSAMGLICFIPFAVFVRGAAFSRHPPAA
jgi:hypothetical protein